MVTILPVSSAWKRPTEREKATLEVRRARLIATERSLRVANRKFSEIRAAAPSPFAAFLRLRNGYVFRDSGVGDASDAQGPPVGDRPPASALVSARGSALRFHLLALAEAQMRVVSGKAPTNRLPLRPSREHPTGWTDLLASWAVSNSGAQHVRAEDKRIRQIHTALDRLETWRLVALPNKVRGAGKYEGFRLLDETASRLSDEEPLLYETPGRGGTTNLPMEFVLNGWVHLLEDGELSVLLMVSCGIGSIPGVGVAIPSDIRVNNYGITRERFEAHRWLQAFGLIDVVPVNRNPDGTAINFAEEGASLHRLSIRSGAFDRDAFEVMVDAIDRRLAL